MKYVFEMFSLVLSSLSLLIINIGSSDDDKSQFTYETGTLKLDFATETWCNRNIFINLRLVKIHEWYETAFCCEYLHVNWCFRWMTVVAMWYYIRSSYLPCTCLDCLLSTSTLYKTSSLQIDKCITKLIFSSLYWFIFNNSVHFSFWYDQWPSTQHHLQYLNLKIPKSLFFIHPEFWITNLSIFILVNNLYHFINFLVCNLTRKMHQNKPESKPPLESLFYKEVSILGYSLF